MVILKRRFALLAVRSFGAKKENMVYKFNKTCYGLK
jgi:hypothetical protein